MMAWSATEQRNGVSAAIRLLSRREWRESSYEVDLRRVVRDAFDHDDRVLRYHAARALRLLEPEPGPALALLRRRLLVEPEPDIAAELVARLAEVEPHLPDDVAAFTHELVDHPLWAGRLASTDSDTVEALGPLVSLVVRLAVARNDQAAARIAVDLFSRPFGRPVSHRGVSVLRPWLALPPERSTERGRAFAIARAVAEALTSLLGTTRADDGIDLYRAASSIVSQLYFASGAVGAGNDRTPTPPPEGFAQEAFPVLEALTAFKEPSTVHELVQTLAHLAPAAPGVSFRIVGRAVGAGDPYTQDGLATDATIDLVKRYLAEFRDVLVSDPEVLSAVRRVLSAFARVGWPSAVALSARLSEAFR